MKRNKLGFSTLEVVLALAIGSIIFVTVMQTLSQLGFTLSRTVQLTQAQMSAVVGLRVLEADISTICMPEYVHKEDKKTDTKDKKTEPISSEKNSSKEKNTETRDKKYFKKACVIKHEGDTLKECVCISMHTVAQDAIVPKKVFYTIEEDKNVSLKNERRYILYRQESSDYTLEKPKNSDKKYMVMRDIISLQLTCWAPQEAAQKDPKKDGKNTAESEKKEEATSAKPDGKKSKKEDRKPLISTKEWDSDAHFKEIQEKEHFPLLPYYIDITLIVAQADKGEVKYTTTFLTPAGFPTLTLTGITPVSYHVPEKDKKDPHAQLTHLSKEQELSAPLNSKIEKEYSKKLAPHK